ncbi:MAG: 50S ribosomal protein L24 [Candidatus Pacebacteria bacterium]|nr:50S ribosomal protein L24 [Candidatus Paceibacterota bacterium]
MKIKTKDSVIVITGKDKGKTGKVIRTIPKEDKVIVEGVNIKKKHQKPRNKGEKGQTIEFTAPVHVSNVMLEDPKTKKATRVGYKTINGKKVRIAQKSGIEV